MPSLNTGNAILSNAIAVNSSYNVGIGGAASSSFKLQVNGTVNLTGALSGTSASFSSTVTAVGYSRFWNGTTGLLVGAFSAGAGYGAIYSTGVTPSSTNFAIVSNGASTYLNATNDAGMTIDNGSKGIFLVSSGNVGIGTSSPTDFGSTYTTLCIDNATNGGVLDLRRNGVRGLTIAVDNSEPRIEARVSGQPLVFYTNNGGTSAARLTIASTGAATFSSSVAIGGAGMGLTGINMPNQNYLAWYVSGGSGGQNVAIRGNGNNLELSSGGGLTMTMDASQRVGIGTSSPLSLLQVGGIGNASVRFGTSSTTNTSSTYSFVAWNSSGNDVLGARGDGLVYAPYIYSTFTTGAAANMGIDTAGGFYRSVSSIKYKKNVENYTKGLAEVMQIRPVFYNSINEKEDGTLYAGLIAEEIHDLGLTEFVQYAEDGTPDALAYQNMIALAFKAIQEQQAQIEEQQKQINSLINR